MFQGCGIRWQAPVIKWAGLACIKVAFGYTILLGILGIQLRTTIASFAKQGKGSEFGQIVQTFFTQLLS